MNRSGFATVNPSTGEQIETFSFYNASQTEDVLGRADKSFQSFRKLSVHRRAQLFSSLAETLRKNKRQLAKVITTEMGKIAAGGRKGNQEDRNGVGRVRRFHRL